VGQVLPPDPRVGRQAQTQGSGKGNPWLAGTLGNIVATAARTDSFLGARYRRIAKRRGKQRAMVATGNSVLVIVYHLLSDPDPRFRDLGANHYGSRIDKQRRVRTLAWQLQALTGQRIVIRNSQVVIVEPTEAA
jgi:transposase